MPRIHPDDIPVIEGELDAAGRRNEVYAARFRAIRPDGSLFHILGVGRKAATQGTKFVGLNFDLTAAATTADLESRRPFGTVARLAGYLPFGALPANENETLPWRHRRTRDSVSRSDKSNGRRKLLTQQALAMMEGRKLRHGFLNPAMFGEPAFDMLLALYVTNASPAILSLRILAPAIGVSEAAANRWSRLLIDDGLVLSVGADKEAADVYVALTDKGRIALDEYFRAIRPLETQ